jgi:glycolate oxidase
VPRGAGTSLSGGALPLADGDLLGLGKFNRILEIDYANRCAVVQPGVTNLGITHAVAACRLLLRARPVEPDRLLDRRQCRGEFRRRALPEIRPDHQQRARRRDGADRRRGLRLGGKHLDPEGYDLLGVIVGSEGLLGVVTEVTVRILPKPATARALLIGFRTVEAAGDCVAAIIAAGIIPAGMEMMDKPAIHAAEAFVHAGYPLDVEALLIVELDGPRGRGRPPDRSGSRRSPRPMRRRHLPDQRSRRSAAFWAGRKAAFPGGRPHLARLLLHGRHHPAPAAAEVLARMRELSKKHGLRVANVFHAGDGNLHPLILYDANQPGRAERAEAFGADILRSASRSAAC